MEIKIDKVANELREMASGADAIPFDFVTTGFLAGALERVAGLVESLSSTDSSEPGGLASVSVSVSASTSASEPRTRIEYVLQLLSSMTACATYPSRIGGELSEHDLSHVLTELASNMEPGADIDDVRDELDGNYPSHQIDQILIHWLDGRLASALSERDLVVAWLGSMDAERMAEDEFEKEIKLPIADRLEHWREYIEQVEGDYTSLRIREQRRASMVEKSTAMSLVDRIENQKATILRIVSQRDALEQSNESKRRKIEDLVVRIATLEAKIGILTGTVEDQARTIRVRGDVIEQLTDIAKAPVPTHDQLVSIICDEPEKFEEAIAEATDRDVDAVRKMLAHSIAWFAEITDEAGELLRDALRIAEIVNDAKLTGGADPIVSPDRQIGDCTCGDECVSPQSVLCRKRPRG